MRTPWSIPVLVLALAACVADEPGAADPEPPTPVQPSDATLEVPHDCPAQAPDDDLFTQAMEPHGLDRGVGIPRSLYDAYGGRIADDPTRRAFFHHLQENPFETACFSGNVATRSDLAIEGASPLGTLVADAALQIDIAVQRDLPRPALDPDAPLLSALDLIHDDDDWDGRDDVEDSADGVPIEVRRAAGAILAGVAEAVPMRDEALEVMTNPDYLDLFWRSGSNHWLLWDLGDPGAVGPINPDSEAGEGLFRAEEGGAERLHQGAVVLAEAVDSVDWTTLAGLSGDFELYAPTPLGAVLLRGAGPDLYDVLDDPRFRDPLLLVIDLGGDDIYRIPAGATASAHNPASVHVDLGGDDLYSYNEVEDPGDDPRLLPSDYAGRNSGFANNNGPFSVSPVARQGAGVFGYGFLLDLGEGDDTYLSLRRSQGFANFGVGVLWDDGGDDEYEAEQGAQGAALTGTGILVDRGGNDRYRAFRNSQGFAHVLSYGLLHDESGNDDYELVVDDIILFGSPQTNGWANPSLGQGTAFGWRRDGPSTHLSGGLALLRDRAGDDLYEGSTFTQGTGYWMGLGILADAAGDDTYHGIFYAQGATAHFAVAAFLEGGGNDRYNPDRRPTHSAIGLAHDFSVTAFVDDAGDDEYYGHDRTIGASKCHGLSLFADHGGDDLYDSDHDRSIGWATDYDWAPDTCGNTINPSYAFFVDVGGADTYVKPTPDGYGDDSLWVTDDPDDPTAREYSAGIDAAEGATGLSAYGVASEDR